MQLRDGKEVNGWELKDEGEENDKNKEKEKRRPP